MERRNITQFIYIYIIIGNIIIEHQCYKLSKLDALCTLPIDLWWKTLAQNSHTLHLHQAWNRRISGLAFIASGCSSVPVPSRSAHDIEDNMQISYISMKATREHLTGCKLEDCKFEISVPTHLATVSVNCMQIPKYRARTTYSRELDSKGMSAFEFECIIRADAKCWENFTAYRCNSFTSEASYRSEKRG